MNNFKKSLFLIISVIITVLTVSTIGCDQSEKPPRYTIGGTVTGISGYQATLSMNSEDTLVLDADGSFVFEKTLLTNKAYSVSVTNQPAGDLMCTVTRGSGTVDQSNVDNILVQCSNFVWSLTGDAVVAEGNSASYIITLSGDTLSDGESASIEISTQDGLTASATEDEDYISVDGNILTITGPATTCSFQIETVTDLSTEGTENYRVQILNPSVGSISSVEYMCQTSILD